MINTKYKDRLFSFISGNPERKDWTLSLYNAVNRSAYTNPEDIEIMTIEDVLYMGMLCPTLYGIMLEEKGEKVERK